MSAQAVPFPRKAMKKRAKAALKRNYLGIFFACTLIAIVMGYVGNPVSSVEMALNADEVQYDHTADDSVLLAPNAQTDGLTNTQIVNTFLTGMGVDDKADRQWTNGVLAVFARNTAGAGDILYGVINTINQLAFKDRISPAIIIGVGVLFNLVILLTLKNVLSVGYCRYLLEMRVYGKTRINRLLYPLQVKRSKHAIKAMCLRTIYQYLWNATIVGGFIKYYSYRLVPFILAENPDIGARDAIKLSRDMMNGYKWKTFILDVTFLPWQLLGQLTFDFVNLFFCMPYTRLTNAELYIHLREIAIQNAIPNAHLLCDRALTIEPIDAEYPVEAYPVPIHPSRRWTNADYKRDYSLSSLILIFFSFSVIGWLWEVALHLFTHGVFVNRGVSYGPWLPIYGFGGVGSVVLLKKVREKPLLTFLSTMILCGFIEYMTSFVLELQRGMRWWDYSGYFVNLNGRVCLEGLLVFAVGGCTAIYLVAPALDSLFNRIPPKTKKALCAVLLSAFAIDQVYATMIPNSGRGITDY